MKTEDENISKPLDLATGPLLIKKRLVCINRRSWSWEWRVTREVGVGVQLPAQWLMGRQTKSGRGPEVGCDIRPGCGMLEEPRKTEAAESNGRVRLRFTCPRKPEGNLGSEG